MDHPAGCTCRTCLTGLGKWNLIHIPEARRRSRRQKTKMTLKRKDGDRS